MLLTDMVNRDGRNVMKMDVMATTLFSQLLGKGDLER